MYKRFFLLSFCSFWTICLISCSSANNKPVLIQFSKDSTAIVISGIDQAGLLQIRNTPHADTAYAQLVAVLQVPSDEGQASMEIPVAGKIKVTKNVLLFIPSMPFVRGGNYQVTTYLNSQFGNATMLVKGKLNYRVKPQQVTLIR